MRYLFNTKELLDVLRSSGLECSAASPFRTLCSLDAPGDIIPLSEEQRLLAAFALQPEQTVLCGRKSSAEGCLYLLRIGAVYYVYNWLEKQDCHVFYAYFDRKGLARMLQRNFCGFFRPNFGAYTELDVTLNRDEVIVWHFIRALYACRARKGTAANAPFSEDDLKNADVATYLRNTLDEVGFSEWSDRIDQLSDETYHAETAAALRGLEEKGVLTADLLPGTEETGWALTRTALERLDDGMLIDTVWYADRTDPEKVREILFCLRRDGVLAYCPTRTGALLRTLPEIPWAELI